MLKVNAQLVTHFCFQAIDLIDEAGSRVRLQHAQLPEEARELDKELRALNKEKDAAVRGQDFEKAGNVRMSSPYLAAIRSSLEQITLCPRTAPSLQA